MSIATLVRQLAAAGASVDVIAIAVEAVEMAEQESARYRSANAERQRRHRENRRNVTHNVTGDVTGNDNPPDGPLSPPAPPLSPLNPPVASETDVSSAEKGASKAKRGTRIPEGATLPDDWRAFAQAEGHPDPEREWLKFTDYWRAQSGSKGVKLDWEATWRNWVRRSVEDGKRRGGGQQQRQRFEPAHDGLFAGGAAVAARFRQAR